MIQLFFKSKRISRLLVIMAVCFSCTPQKKEVPNNELVIPYEPLEEVFLEEYFTDVAFVQLDNQKEALLNGLGRIDIGEDSIIVQTERQITFFNFNGDYLGRLNRQGLGPAEYERIADFQKYGGEIIILDNNNNGLLFYDAQSLTHSKTIPLTFQGASSFEIYEEYFFFHKSDQVNQLSEGKDEFEILVTDFKGKILKGYLPITSVKLGVATNAFALDRPFGVSGHGIVHSNGFRNDSIYKMTPQSIEAQLMTFPNRPDLQETYGKSLTQFSIQELMLENDKFHLGPFFNYLTEQSMSFVYLYESKFIWHYNKSKEHLFTASRLIHNASGIPVIPPSNYSNGSFISVLNSEWLASELPGMEQGNKTELFERAESILSNDLNPMLVIYKERL